MDMNRRARAFAFVLLISGILVSIGVALWSVPAALIITGLELAGWSWVVLSE